MLLPGFPAAVVTSPQLHQYLSTLFPHVEHVIHFNFQCITFSIQRRSIYIQDKLLSSATYDDKKSRTLPSYYQKLQTRIPSNTFQIVTIE